MTTVRLMVANGSGRLVRRPLVVMFDPLGEHQDLAERFEAAPTDGEAIDTFKKFLIDSAFDASPLVVAEWAQAEFNLLVFGDVEVHTSAVAAPMVSGAGSSTWVERHLGEIELGGASTVEVWCGDQADPSTNLGLGVVASGGFRMSLHVSELTADIGAEATTRTTDVAAVLGAKASTDTTTASEPAPVPVEEPIAVPQPGLISEQANRGDVAAEGVALADGPHAGPPPAPPAPSAPVADAPGFDPDDSITEAAPLPSTDPFDTADDSSAGVHPGLIEASHCPQRHPNPPQRANCYVCGEALLEDQSLGLIEQPTVGRVVFPGDQAVPLSRAIMLGRRPDVSATGAHPVVIEHEEVSRSHALVSIEGWTVLLTDQGSRNGTWVASANDPTPVRLDAQVPHVLEHGTSVHLGAPEVSFTYYFDSP